MMKATALASTVTLMDITGVARTIVAKTFAPYEVFIAAALIYLIMAWVFQTGFGKLEQATGRYLKKES
jgi:polar amino acid transport system permease protein